MPNYALLYLTIPNQVLRLDLGVQISNKPYKHGGTGGRIQP